jgi:hypothetical protein
MREIRTSGLMRGGERLNETDNHGRFNSPKLLSAHSTNKKRAPTPAARQIVFPRQKTRFRFQSGKISVRTVSALSPENLSAVFLISPLWHDIAKKHANWMGGGGRNAKLAALWT